MLARQITTGLMVGGACAGLSACQTARPDDDPAPMVNPVYLAADVAQMGGDLVQVKVAMKGARTPDDVTDYARCTAAAFALKGQAGFVRQVRTITDKEGGIWRADAVYSVTSALPAGMQTIDADVTVQDCHDRGIPAGN
jgi:hypothetical protein